MFVTSILVRRGVFKGDSEGLPYWERDIYSHGGASNVGLLVKTSGVVTNIGPGYFYLDGVAAFDDGDEIVNGVRVDWPFDAPSPTEGTFVHILGISSCRIVHDETHGDVIVRMLRPISPEACTYEE
jgi:hypothetical protein